MTEKISDAELIKLFNKNKLFDLFNMTVLEVDTTAGNIKVEFDIDKKYCNPAGDVQGGIVSGMVDDATALAFIFQNHFKKRPPTIELKTNPSAFTAITVDNIKLGDADAQTISTSSGDLKLNPSIP